MLVAISSKVQNNLLFSLNEQNNFDMNCTTIQLDFKNMFSSKITKNKDLHRLVVSRGIRSDSKFSKYMQSILSTN